jgi:hypothetical protein
MQNPEGEDEKAPLKKIQNYVPGFRGYTQEDDIRDADRMLRMLMSQKILLARKSLEESHQILEEKMLFSQIDSIDFLLNALKRIASEIGYADSGMSWLASDSEMLGEDFERLYEYDAQLLDHVTTVLRVAEDLRMCAGSSDLPSISKNAIDIRSRLSIIEDLFRKRMLILNRQG